MDVFIELSMDCGNYCNQRAVQRISKKYEMKWTAFMSGEKEEALYGETEGGMEYIYVYTSLMLKCKIHVTVLKN